MAKVFITGASGFVGSHLVEDVKKLGWEIHAAVRQSSKTEEIREFVDKFVYPDFGNVQELSALFQQDLYDYFIHSTELYRFKYEVEILLINVGMTQNLMQAVF